MAHNIPFLELSEAEVTAYVRRESRKTEAIMFRREYSYGVGTNATEGKTCIWPGNAYSWSEKSSGIMWVGVHGKNSICVVTKAGDLDISRVHNSLLTLTKEVVLRRFRRALISEIEDLADKSSKLREMLDQSIEVPFGVVSVIPGTGKVYKGSVYDETYETYGYKSERLWTLRWRESNPEQASSDEHENDKPEEDEYFKNVVKNEKIGRQSRPPQYRMPPSPVVYDETKTIRFLLEKMKTEKMKTGVTCTTNETIQASIDEYDEEKAVQFLQEKMIKDKAFSVDETIQIAISAFQHLFKKKFIADKIEVSVMDPDYFVLCAEAHYKDIYVKHLETSDIEQHLAVINAPTGSSGSSSPPQQEYMSISPRSEVRNNHLAR